MCRRRAFAKISTKQNKTEKNTPSSQLNRLKKMVFEVNYVL